MPLRKLGPIQQFDASRELFAPYGFTCEKWCFDEMMPRTDRHNEIELVFRTEGSLTYLLGGRRIKLPANRLLVFWAARPHQVVAVDSPTPTFCVTIPLAMFLSWNLPENLTQHLLQGSFLLEKHEARASLDHALLKQWYEDFRNPSPEQLKTVKLEIAARLRRLADTSCRHQDGAFESTWPYDTPEAVLTTAERIALFVAKHCTESIQTADIGKAVGVHPDYAASLFRRTFGVTLNHYVLENRMFHAQHLLAATDNKILDVCLDCGYQSVSRFYVAFKAICGCTPREYRTRFRN